MSEKLTTIEIFSETIHELLLEDSFFISFSSLFEIKWRYANLWCLWWWYVCDAKEGAKDDISTSVDGVYELDLDYALIY